MFTSRTGPRWLLALSVLVITASSVATAGKPQPPPSAPVQYTVIPLGGLGYSSTYANDINSSENIVGRVVDGDTGECIAVCWRSATNWECEDLNDAFSENVLDGGYLCNALRTNNAGLVAGLYKDKNGIAHVCVCNPSSTGDEQWLRYFVNDGGFSYSIRDMNNDGTVVGYVGNDDDVMWGFVWNYLWDAPLLLDPGYLLSGINDSGVAIGIIGDTVGEMFRCKTDINPQVTDIEPLGVTARLFAPYQGRPAISNDGTIAATVAVKKFLEPRRLPHGVGEWELLVGEGMDYNWCGVSDINDEGQICGIWNPRKPRDWYPGFVYVGGLFGPLVDYKDQYFGWWGVDTVIPRAIADGSGAVVAWQGGYSYLLLPPLPQ